MIDKQSKKQTIIMVNQYGAQSKLLGFGRYPNWGKVLVSKGFEVYIVCDSNIHNSEQCMLKKGEPFCEVVEEGVHYVYIKTPKYNGNNLSRVFNLIGFYYSSIKMLRRLPKASLVLAQTPSPLACFSALQYSKKTKIPCICDDVDLWPEPLAVYKGFSKHNFVFALLKRLQKHIYMDCDKLVFSMDGGKQYIADNNWCSSIDEKKISIIHTGVDVRLFDELKNRNQVNEYSFPEKKFIVTYCGSVRLANGVKILCDAGKIIQEKGYRDIVIFIQGAGNEVDYLRNYCIKERISNVTIFGRIEKNDIPYVLSNTDICVLCYQNTPLLKYGGSMNKLFDYFASGKPIISNARMGYSLITAYNCGSELGTNSAEPLANEIIKYYEMPKAKLMELGMNSRKAAEDNDIQIVGNQLFEIITELLNTEQTRRMV